MSIAICNFSPGRRLIQQQESTPVGCMPPALKLYVFQFQLPPLDVAPMGCRVGLEMNKFDQVSNDPHQMSLAEGGYVQRSIGGGYVCGRGVASPM